MKWKYIPNLLTIARILMTAPFLYYLVSEEYKIAFYIVMTASFTDSLDGILARRYNWITDLGSKLDPLADKLLIVTSFAALAYLNVVPLWLFILVLSRDMIILAGVAAVYILCGGVKIEPSQVSKLNTCLQVGLIASLVFELAFQLLPTLFIQGLMACMVLTTVISVVDYMWIWGWYTYRNRQT